MHVFFFFFFTFTYIKIYFFNHLSNFKTNFKTFFIVIELLPKQNKRKIFPLLTNFYSVIFDSMVNKVNGMVWFCLNFLLGSSCPEAEGGGG